MVCCLLWLFFFFKQKTAYEMRISDWSSDVCSSDLRYRRNIRRLPRYLVTSRDVPVSQQRLFVGRGFRWEQRHTHRLMQTYRPEFRRYVEPTAIYRAARRLEERLEFAPFPVSTLARALAWDSPLNPARPLPPVGGKIGRANV